eukprot:Protomagalhaensia_sp_Gyna_25__4931@NODE_52_length_6070_cov_248_257005_g39_i0_p10_GENE_NODE_52_length_6070_cov_248_257005_g39_i0NODE_52_length_6070_cov_248_257005_g39_i0_p10_ORF_typecomplete_len100_score11_44_NODE_52_length_6070_cov_248_257005_g39_i036713970
MYIFTRRPVSCDTHQRHHNTDMKLYIFLLTIALAWSGEVHKIPEAGEANQEKETPTDEVEEEEEEGVSFLAVESKPSKTHHKHKAKTTTSEFVGRHHCS